MTYGILPRISQHLVNAFEQKWGRSCQSAFTECCMLVEGSGSEVRTLLGLGPSSSTY